MPMATTHTRKSHAYCGRSHRTHTERGATKHLMGTTQQSVPRPTHPRPSDSPCCIKGQGARLRAASGGPSCAAGASSVLARAAPKKWKLHPAKGDFGSDSCGLEAHVGRENVGRAGGGARVEAAHNRACAAGNPYTRRAQRPKTCRRGRFQRFPETYWRHLSYSQH